MIPLPFWKRIARAFVCDLLGRPACEILLRRQFNSGVRHGHHPKLSIVREGESNSRETPRRYRKVRRMQSGASSDG
jgi:hypothetical protein